MAREHVSMYAQEHVPTYPCTYVPTCPHWLSYEIFHLSLGLTDRYCSFNLVKPRKVFPGKACVFFRKTL